VNKIMIVGGFPIDDSKDQPEYKGRAVCYSLRPCHYHAAELFPCIFHTASSLMEKEFHHSGC
jgi:hypothetical protein